MNADPSKKKAQHLQYDNLDDRREIVTLLRRLPPRRKIAFLEWACGHAKLLPRSTTRPNVAFHTYRLARLAETDDSADERLAMEVYMDLWSISNQWIFDLDEAVRRLVQMVRSHRDGG